MCLSRMGISSRADDPSAREGRLDTLRLITRSGQFWRTFLLLAGLVIASIVSVFAAYRLLERAPPEQRLAWEITSIVNLTRSALLGSDPARRMLMLEALVREEEVRVLPLEPTDRIDTSRTTPSLRALESRLGMLLSDTTTVAGRVNDENGLWVSFDLSGDSYWLLLPARRADRQIDPTLGVIVLIAVVLASGGALAIAWFIDRPLAQLSRAIGALSRGDTPPRLKEDGPPQLARVNQQFNRMARDLADLEHDRTLGLAGISHDLRGPLTRLRIEVELASIQALQREAMVEDISRIDAIVGQFIDYARSNQPPRTRTVDTSEALTVIADRYAPDIRSGKLVLSTAIEPAVTWQGDPTDLQRLVVNLIDNAIRYASDETTGPAVVNLKLESIAQGISIDIRDRGPGIPEDRFDEALRPFARLDAARTDPGGTHPGTGLGLAIVARIVRRYGGTLTLSNAPEGGLCVHLQLPNWSHQV
ncbi:MAG: HAMP domain-containing protein [Betaproteobacteria bacterium]|nr:HAMP domain-containing protein [Betaproteobacteria bacterium]